MAEKSLLQSHHMKPMIDAHRYHFSDFTTNNYARLLKIAKSRYTFKTFTDFNKDEKCIIWRHDVDLSMHRALKIAQIDAHAKVKSTFFILLHSQFYNLLDDEISDLVKTIAGLGHDIGVHFDTHYYNITSEK